MDTIEPQSNEVFLRQDEKWLYFSKPHLVITTQDLGGILPALQEIEDRVNSNGWHAAGLISYEAAPAFDKALNIFTRHGEAMSEGGFPLIWFGLYPKPRLVALPKPASPKESLTWSPTTDRDTYNASIEKIKDRIAQGQTYQVNYTMRLLAEFKADPWNFFLHLAQTQNNHAAYIDTGKYIIASASPELFFQLDGERITCRPMKGTVKRGRTNLEDEEKARWLSHSEKNRAENVMIVDMIRNDLGRIARVGSVHVPEMFATKKYPTLWQMTSTVQAKTSASITNIINALFPCASITGAPKVSTMKIISELETSPREIYTGSIGHIEPGRKAIFNVAIRTALIDRETQTAKYGVGGGIVWDSTSTDEHAEALLKARVLTESQLQFSLLETILWTPEDGFFLRDKHIARLLDSAEYFKIYASHESIEAYLDRITSHFVSPQRVRVLLDKNSNLSHEAKPFHASNDHPPLKVCLARESVNSGNVFLFHKTTCRDVYDSARKNSPDCDDVLLYNEEGELTEFTLGNLVVELDGKLYTPPVSCGLLAGTFRAHMLEMGQVEERIIPVNDLNKCTRVFSVNSVRKMQMVKFPE